MAKDKKKTPEHKRALEIFNELMPNWRGSIMLFPGIYGRNVEIDGEKIYKIILKAVKNSRV